MCSSGVSANELAPPDPCGLRGPRSGRSEVRGQRSEGGGSPRCPSACALGVTGLWAARQGHWGMGMLRHVTTKGGRAPLPLPKQIRGDSPPPYRSRRCWGWEGTSGTYPTPCGTREQEVGEVSGARHPGQELAACPAVPGSQLAPSRSSPSAACVPALRGGEAGGAAPSTPNRGWHQLELASGGMLVASPLGWHLPGEQHPAQVVSPWGG